jgi:hypothetical protein
MERKDKYMPIKWSKSQLDQIKSHARKVGKSPSTWVREAVCEVLGVASGRGQKSRIDAEVDRTLYNRFRGFVSAYNNEKRTFMSHDEQRQVSELGASQWAELPLDRIDEAFTVLTNFTRHPNNAGALLEDLITGTKLVITRTMKGEK